MHLRAKRPHDLRSPLVGIFGVECRHQVVLAHLAVVGIRVGRDPGPQVEIRVFELLVATVMHEHDRAHRGQGRDSNAAASCNRIEEARLGHGNESPDVLFLVEARRITRSERACRDRTTRRHRLGQHRDCFGHEAGQAVRSTTPVELEHGAYGLVSFVHTGQHRGGRNAFVERVERILHRPHSILELGSVLVEHLARHLGIVRLQDDANVVDRHFEVTKASHDGRVEELFGRVRPVPGRGIDDRRHEESDLVVEAQCLHRQ